MRLPEFQAALRDAAIPAAVLTNFEDGVVNPNFFYFTQFDGYGCLWVPAKGSPILFAPQMEFSRAKRSGIRTKVLKKGTLQKLKVRKLGVDFSRTDMLLAKSLRKSFKAELIDIAPMVERLRMRKTSSELKSLMDACKISDAIINTTFAHLGKFKTEFDVANFMNTEAAKHGVPLSFDTIVAAGPNAAVPHHKPTHARLRGFVVIDFGVKVNGYCSDTSRTLFIGNPTARDRALYQLVLDAQEAAIAAAERDRRCAKLHEIAATALGAYKKQFIHGLGHGVGVQIHEAPSLSPHSKHLLLDDVPFTVEPGIYLPGKLGIRIEDTCVLRNGRVHRLTRCTKKFVVKK